MIGSTRKKMGRKTMRDRSDIVRGFGKNLDLHLKSNDVLLYKIKDNIQL